MKINSFEDYKKQRDQEQFESTVGFWVILAIIAILYFILK